LTSTSTTSAPFPLTDLQAGYLVGTSRLIELGGFRPTMYFELDLVGLDPARAELAINQLVQRHEHLRTVVLAEGTQRVLDADELVPVRLPVVDVAGLSRQRQEEAVRQTRERMCEQGTDPTGWPLFEIVIHRLRRHRYRVHFAMSLLLLDSRSTYQLVDEWSELYRDPAAALPATPLTFRECLLASLGEDDTEARREHWRYWEERLDTLPPAPQLPLARPLASIDPVRLTRRTWKLTDEQWRRLGANARAHRVLPNTALLHAFAETLGAWAETPRFCLNVLHQNWVNTHPESAGVVGQFSSTLPLEVDLRRSSDFWQRAQHLQRQLFRDMPHSDVTAVQITRELAARRGWTSHAVLPYVFNSMLAPDRGAGAPGRPACRTVTSNLRTPQVLVDNQLQDTPDGGIACVWDVVDDAFPDGLADSMFDAYRRMLAGLASPDGVAPDPVPAAHRTLVAADNAAAGTPPPGRLEDGFLDQVTARPDAPAVITGRRRLTYRELEIASRAVAGWLRDRGIGPGDIVPVVMEKGWEQVAAVLGTVRAGAAYCPVDAGLPEERIRHLLGECAAPAVLGQSWNAANAVLTDHGPALLEVDREPAGRYPAAPLPAVPGAATDLAYVIYTSGSTGRPKGVMIEHRSALNTVHDINRRIGLSPADRVFGISSLSFDLSVWDVFGALAAGAALVLPDHADHPDPIGWAGATARHGVTVWNSVPALAEMLVEVTEQLPDGQQRPPIRAFLLSGDWVPTPLPDRIRRQWPAVRITALGGATEASIWSNCYEIGQVDPSWHSIPYGRPLSNQTMQVLDHRFNVRLPWAVGRIYIGGVGLARGYLGDDERTAERFHSHPDRGDRLYWTGDLGRYWPDGTIEFLGREDRQLKIQGFRVEPGEVESVIHDAPGVRDCAVGAEAAPGGQRRLVALVVPQDGATLDPSAVTAHLRARLPYYMVPGQLQVVDRLPLSANGKVDVSQVPAGSGPAAGNGSGPAPDSPLARRLAGLWAELLEVPAVGLDSDFFALGGNSLLALRLVNRIRTELGVELSFGQIFQAPTLQALAALVAADHETATCAVELTQSATGDQPCGDGPELFLFHPVGGSVTSYLGLARAWTGPVRAFQSPALNGAVAPTAAAGLDPDLESAAARYREELQRWVPAGPYLLGGWSMGGVLAHEVARQLAERGQPARVFMIDSDITNVRAPETELASHLEFLSDLAGGQLPSAAATVVAAAADGRGAGSGSELARAARDAAVAYQLLPSELDLAGYQRLFRVHVHNLAVLASYRPDSSAVPTLLFVAGAVDRTDPVSAWREVCPHLEVEVWPHDHYSIVADGSLAAIAGRVRSWLAAGDG
jgi:amino acid adenylation domain-containing protein